ncbi:uncharacterized protein LOC127581023 [Pristis pectinata]|uniref:uncharacterized protein LOC127581023 n=1 Tax=Pristis pectinata TaxID=685728 RepID=UPI00223E2B6C|nr:uncharacterized protein LOC127581023 [Pristis pectinata]
MSSLSLSWNNLSWDQWVDFPAWVSRNAHCFTWLDEDSKWTVQRFQASLLLSEGGCHRLCYQFSQLWLPMLCTLVSGALWAERDVSGVMGRTITIDCHYEGNYRLYTKYWCRGWNRHCSVLVETNGQHGRRGRASITDNPARGIFTVTVEDLHSGDTGWYSCGITTPGNDPTFPVHLQVSDEPVSVPVLGFQSPANASCAGGSVSVSCESVQGSLSIQYAWYEKTQSVDSKISDTSKLDLHCQSFKHQHHQCNCTASNVNGTKSSEVVNATVFSGTGTCSYVTEINSNRAGYFCETSATESMTTAHSSNTEIRSNDTLHDMECAALGALRSAGDLEYLSHVVHKRHQEKR